MALVVDLSNNNPLTDFPTLKKHGVEGIWHKVTEGNGFVDQDWLQRSKRARQAGLRVGGYHFGHPNTDPRTQARFFANHLGKIERRDLRPVLDLEVMDGMTSREVVKWARDFNHKFKDQKGVYPLFYSSTAFIHNLNAEKPIGSGLWLADWGVNDGIEHHYYIPNPWKKAVAHQFTSRGHIAGVSGYADLNRVPVVRSVLAHPIKGLLP